MRVTVVLAAFCLLCLAGPALAQAPTGRDTAGGAVDIVEVSGPIDGTVSAFLRGAIASAQTRNVEVLVIRLDSAGLIGDDFEDLEELRADVEHSTVPIAVWVGPPGAEASDSALWLTQSAHVLALAPASALETLSGIVVAVPDGEAGVPVPPGAALPAGADRSEVRTLDEAGLVEAGIADLVAVSLPQVLARLDGFAVTVAGEGVRTLHVDPRAATVRFVNMGLLDRVLHSVASPTLAYLLVVAGALALCFELFQPGFGVSGVAGIGLMGLGGYGLWVLPTSWSGVALIAAGFLFLAADLSAARLGWLTATGTLGLGFGSLVVFPDPARPPVWLLVSVVAFCLVFFAVIMTVVLRAQGNQGLANARAVIGTVGVVRSMLNPEGHVFVGGGLWRARVPSSAGKVKTGTKVRVVGMNDRLTLDVEVVDEEPVAETAYKGAGS